MLLMRFFLTIVFLAGITALSAQTDSTQRFRKVRMGVFTAISHQVAVNGGEADTDMGNFGFKGYLQPELGIALRYQQDSSEFGLLTISASRLNFSVANVNTLLANGNSYPVINRMDIFLSNYAANVSYHKRITRKSPRRYLSLETGIGIHVMNCETAAISSDTAVGPYSISRTLNYQQSVFALPSAELGLNLTLVPEQAATEFTFGLRGEVYLGKSPEITYHSYYTRPADSFSYYFRWSPMLLTPKLYVLAVF